MKIISIRERFCADHSAADYTFISSKRLTQAERKKIARRWRKETAYKGEEGEEIGVGEDGFARESWCSWIDDLENEFINKYFDVMIKRYQDFSTGDVLKFGYDYNEELYQKLERYECNKDFDVYIRVKKEDGRIILEIRVYMSPYAVFEHKGKEFMDFIKGIREDILNGNLTVLRVIGEFYGLEAKVDWKEIGSPGKVARLFRKMLKEREDY